MYIYIYIVDNVLIVDTVGLTGNKIVHLQILIMIIYLSNQVISGQIFIEMSMKWFKWNVTIEYMKQSQTAMSVMHLFITFSHNLCPQTDGAGLILNYLVTAT